MIADKVIHTICHPKILASRLPPSLSSDGYETRITLLPKLPNNTTRALGALNGV